MVLIDYLFSYRYNIIHTFCRKCPVKILTLFLVGVGPVRGPTSCHERGQGVVGWGLSPGGCFPR